jgi:CheY-like chemotaxis protein
VAKILVADDNSNIQKMVGLALKDQGIDVVAVGNGEAAVRKISELRPDLVLADVFMPVRSGYEVCSYVKQDPALAHIPVILLVGAFDPLDEQEAQRVGADGVLKKPFVPPDPLISMVKSALARAGVPLGNEKPVEKTPETPKRSTAELLSPAASKLAELAPAKLPEPDPEPLPEDLPSFVTEVRIEAGQEPIAFGSLLETPEAEDDAAFLPPKPQTILGQEHKWGSDEPEEEEEEEEESGASGNGWRPGGDLDKSLEQTEASKAAPDWREEAFHGSSPAKPHRSHRWAPVVEEPAFAEASGSRAVAVSTLEEVKRAEVPAFSGDAWAAAMAAGVEEKLTETHVVESPAVEATATPEAVEQVAQAPSHEASVEQELAQARAELNSFSGSPSPWELEAKKATLLASTWDHAAAESTPSFSNGAASEVVEAPAAEAAPVDGPHYASEAVAEPAVHEEPAEAQPSAYVHEEIVATPSAAAEHAESRVNETQEIEPYRELGSAHPENTWVSAPPEVASQFVETPAQEFAPSHAEESSSAEQPTSAGMSAPASEPLPEVVAEVAAQPNMEELVARVLSRMSPDVLQKVTRDILKPVIEAIIQDELNSKKQ